VFERFTEPSRRLVVLAQEESRVLGHDYVGTEHLFVAATEVDDRLTATLAGLGITTEVVRGQITRMVAPVDPQEGGTTSFTPEASQALEGSRREALQLGHDYIAPAHIVLGLLATHDGTMPVLLSRLGISPETLRLRLITMFDGVPPERMGEDGVVFTPLCPRCFAPLEGNVRLVDLDADGGRVRLACCAACGAVLPAMPAP
jgi:ATP-dependent Clp protease ATP-binding subunit ClpC